MIEFRNSITINIPVEGAFDFVANAENLPLWNYYIKSVTKIESGSGLGVRYRQIRKHDEQTFEVTQYEQHKVIELTTIPNASLYAKRRMIFSAVAGGTTVEDNFALDTGYPSFLQKLFQGRIRRAVRQNLEILKTLLETGHATLQDGRVVRI